METSFKVQDYQDGQLIRLSSPLNSRTRFLGFFHALNFFAAAAGFTFLLFTHWRNSFIGSIIILFCIVAFLIASFRFINKATETEKLFVNKERMEIIASGLLKIKKESFLLADISDFKFLEKQRYEPHPLKGETFDYLGFQTQQQVIQDLHSEGRAAFVYRGRQVNFGKELVSWEFSELEVLLYELTGNDFRYPNKQEQENFSRQ